MSRRPFLLMMPLRERACAVDARPDLVAPVANAPVLALMSENGTAKLESVFNCRRALHWMPGAEEGSSSGVSAADLPATMKAVVWRGSRARWSSRRSGHHGPRRTKSL